MDDQTPIQGDGHIDSISLARLGVLTWQQAELQAPPITALQGGEGLLQQAEHGFDQGQGHHH